MGGHNPAEYAEIKWRKVTDQYLNKYISIMSLFFDLIEENKVKIRIMFTKNTFVPRHLDSYQKKHQYHVLYYQFLKHAFGLDYSNHSKVPTNIRLYLDKLPDSKMKNDLFKSFIGNLNNYEPFQKNNIKIKLDQIAEVDSHKHVILQCLDIILGAMSFRLNDKHLRKRKGSKRRGKKTIAKEKLYKYMIKRIGNVFPHFNIGRSTSMKGKIENRWEYSYSHWLFRPKDFEYDSDYEKP